MASWCNAQFSTLSELSPPALLSTLLGMWPSVKLPGGVVSEANEDCQRTSSSGELASASSERQHLATRGTVGDEAIDETSVAARKVQCWLNTMHQVWGEGEKGYMAREASKLRVVVQHLAGSNVCSRFDVDSLDRFPVARTVWVVQATHLHLASYRSAICLA